MSGAPSVPQLEGYLASAGFTDVSVRVKPDSKAVIDSWLPGQGAGEHVLSAVVLGSKPLESTTAAVSGSRQTLQAPAAVADSGGGGC